MAEGTEIPGSTPATTTNVTSETATTQSLKVMHSDVYMADKAVSAMDSAVSKGKLQLDEGSAEALIKALADARDQVQSLYDEAKPKLETPLKFGSNPVADAISAKFTDISVGSESSAVYVMERLIYILHDVEDTVKNAVTTTQHADEDLAQDMKRNGAS
ncbi:hypothetical protein FKR81_15365 [Lentzea tibetensis]|uniref:Uncharacterized protein n=1 Tax=Lentzea tibetensis TaxID=2591470 RepID=A0A563EV79_9PSEU|nr:hypothetical protein [Lentzea tibetensis]TWP51569.1 hypothetical protein FKR81_15365 [Lentzea tibetensis]